MVANDFYTVFYHGEGKKTFTIIILNLNVYDAKHRTARRFINRTWRPNQKNLFRKGHDALPFEFIIRPFAFGQWQGPGVVHGARDGRRFSRPRLRNPFPFIPLDVGRFYEDRPIPDRRTLDVLRNEIGQNNILYLSTVFRCPVPKRFYPSK